MKYLWHKCPRICSVSRSHNPLISSFMTYHWVCKESNNDGFHMWSKNCLSCQSTCVCTRFFSFVRVVHVVQLHVLMFSFPCCSVRYDFLVKPMFDSSQLPFCFAGGPCLFVFCFCFGYVYLFTYSCVQHDFYIILCSCRLAVTRWVPLVDGGALEFTSRILVGFVLLDL